MKRPNTKLERAALWLWREIKVMDELLQADATCTCSWCRAKRAFAQACRDHVTAAKGRK